MARTMVVRGRLVLEDRVAPGRLALSDGVITSVEPDDGEDGPLICPGFADVHVHGHGGHDAMGGTAALDGMAKALLRRGVTSFLPTAVTAPLATLRQFAEDVRSWRARTTSGGAQALGFNLEGPFIDPVRKGAQNPEFIIAPADVSTADLEPLLEQWRMVTMAPELPGALELIRWLTARGVVISLGHSGATAEQAAEAYAAGATSTTHLFNAMSGIHHHSPGLATAALSLDEAYVEFIADGQHVDRMLWPIVTRTKPAERFVLVTDAISLAATDQSHGSIGGLAVEVHGDRCTLVDGGALAGSVISLDTAVRNLVRSGVSLPRAVAAATVHPLSLIGCTDRGRLAPGQRADLLELDEDLGVQRVMLNGEWVGATA